MVEGVLVVVDTILAPVCVWDMNRGMWRSCIRSSKMQGVLIVNSQYEIKSADVTSENDPDASRSRSLPWKAKKLACAGLCTLTVQCA